MGDLSKEEKLPNTLPDLQRHAEKWSLAGDAGMLQYLQDYSQKLMSRTHNLQQQMNLLLYDTNLTNVRVQNTFNDFIHLSNMQFIENRVYEEDLGAEKQKENKEQQVKSKEQFEAELIPKITNAVTLCLSVIEKAYEKVDVKSDDSDSEDSSSNVRQNQIMILKDPYVHRPLPFIIGTPMFFQDDTVGLIDKSPEIEEEKQFPPQENKLEAVSNNRVKEVMNSGESSSSLEKSQSQDHLRKEKLFGSSDDENSEEEDLFSFGRKNELRQQEEEETSSDEDDTVAAPPPQTNNNDFLSELSKKLNKEPTDNNRNSSSVEKLQNDNNKVTIPEKNEKSSANNTKPSSNTSRQPVGGLFGAEDEDDDLFSFSGKKAKTGGLFSKSKGLFDDDEDDQRGNISTATSQSAAKKEEEVKKASKEDKEKQPQSNVLPSISKANATVVDVKTNTKPKASIPNIFDDQDDDEDLFSVSTSTAAKSVTKAKVEPEVAKAISKPANAGKDLFGDDEDDKDDLFAVKPKQQTVVGTKAQETSKSELLNSIESNKQTSDEDEMPKKKLPAGAVSLFGAQPSGITAALNARQAVAKNTPDKNDDSDGWSTDNADENPLSKSVSITKNTSTPKETKKAVITKPIVSADFKADDDDGDNLFAPPKLNSTKQPEKKQPAAKSFADIFGDDEDDDSSDLFTPISSKSNSSQKIQQQKQQEQPSKPPQSDITETQSNTGDKKPLIKPTIAHSASKQKSALFDDNEDDNDDLFSVKKSSGVVSTSRIPTDSSSVKQKSEPDNFTVVKDKSSSSSAKSSESKAKGLSLFMDDEEDDDLFAGTKGNLFASKTAIKKPNESDVTKQVPITKEPVVSLPVNQSKATPLTQPTTSSSVSVISVPPSNEETNKNQSNSAVKPKVESGKKMFSSSEDEDDLFSLIKKSNDKQQVPVTESKKQQLQLTSDDLVEENTPPVVNNIIHNDNSKESSISSATAPKPWKPAGAVSMFGQLDPSTIGKQKNRAQEPSSLPDSSSSVADKSKHDLPPFDLNQTETLSKLPELTKPTSPLSQKVPPPITKKRVATPPASDSLSPDIADIKADFNSSKTSALEDRNTKLSSSSEQSQPVGKLKVSLAINPAALLPGATRPVAQPENFGVSFDSDPVNINALHNVTKDRVGLKSGRRPPSRKTLGSSSNTLADNVLDIVANTTTGNVNETSAQDKSLTGNLTKETEKVKVSSDSIKRTVVVSDETSVLLSNEPISSLVSGKLSNFSSAENTNNTLNTERSAPTQDLLTSSSTHAYEKNISNDLFALGKEHSVKPKVSIFANDDDVLDSDLFGDTKSRKTTLLSKTTKDNSSVIDKKSSENQSRKSLLTKDDNDLEDIFVTNKVSKTDKTKRADVGRVDEIKSDEILNSANLEGNSANPQSASIKTVDTISSSIPVTSAANKQSKLPIFNDDDDLFASSKYVSKSIVNKDGKSAVNSMKVSEPFMSSRTADSKEQSSSHKDAPHHLSAETVTKEKGVGSSGPRKADEKEERNDPVDIFAISKPANKKEKVDSVDIFAVNTDLFSTSKKKNDFDSLSKDIFGEDKLTAGSVKSKRVETKNIDKSKSAEEKVKDATLPEVKDIVRSNAKDEIISKEEQDDDIFATSYKSSKVKPQKAARLTDDDLFKDTTDIFANISVPNEKTKKKSQKNKTLNDQDDIFADTKLKTKQSSSGASSQLTNIFDDPLNALTKN